VVWAVKLPSLPSLAPEVIELGLRDLAAGRARILPDDDALERQAQALREEVRSSDVAPS
jgi:hypothetical protein